MKFEPWILHGDNPFPPVLAAFGILMLFLSTRLMTLRLYPFQRTSHGAFIYVVAVDIIAWIFLKTGIAASFEVEDTTRALFTPAGEFYMAAVFLPHQLLLLFTLCFRGQLPFHALLYSCFLLCSLTYIYTHFAASAFGIGDGKVRCDDEGILSQSLVAISVILVVTAAYRTHRDRVNMILLSYAFLGLLNWSLCAKNMTSTGWPFLVTMLFVHFMVKVDDFSKFDITASKPENTKARYYRNSTLKDIKKVAVVIDGFVGPRGVVCGISRSYEAWILEIMNQGRDVVIFSAFPKEEIEEYFNEKNISQSKLTAYQVETLDIKYVSQIYYATRYTLANIKLVSHAFHVEKPDVVHSVFDGTSVPLFSWACALLRIPIVGIMHTDSIVICERNGFKLMAPLILMSQKLCGAGLESIATRSKSFAQEMLRLRNWKCDHVIKPHVRTEVFKPIKDDRVLAIRKKLVFDDPSTDLSFDSNSLKFSDGKFVLLYAGRFDIDKRVDELLQLHEMLKENKNIYLAMIGGGSLADDIKALHGIKNRVFCHSTFLSHEELSLFYNAADIHISASQMETLGNTVLESMACGTPVLVPRAQGFVDTVSDQETGILWDIEKGVEDAKHWVLKLESDTGLMKKLKKGANSKIKHLTCENAVSDLMLWYVEAAENRRLKTLFLSRLVTSSFLLVQFFLFDRLFLGHIKRVLQSFSDKEVREKNRKEHLNTTQ